MTCRSTVQVTTRLDLLYKWLNMIIMTTSWWHVDLLYKWLPDSIYCKSDWRWHDGKGLASDDITKHSNAWQRGKLVLNKESVPYKSMLGEKSLTGRSSFFFCREVWKVWQVFHSLVCHMSRDIRDWTRAGPFFGRSTVSVDHVSPNCCLKVATKSILLNRPSGQSDYHLGGRAG